MFIKFKLNPDCDESETTEMWIRSENVKYFIKDNSGVQLIDDHGTHFVLDFKSTDSAVKYYQKQLHNDAFNNRLEEIVK